MKIELLEYPTEKDWMEVKRRALVTVGKKPVNPPDSEWKRRILWARHSPIRYLRFSFYLEIPYYVSVHLVRHVHAQPYVRSLMCAANVTTGRTPTTAVPRGRMRRWQ